MKDGEQLVLWKDDSSEIVVDRCVFNEEAAEARNLMPLRNKLCVARFYLLVADRTRTKETDK